MRRFTAALAPGLALAAVYCVLGGAAGCGRETFDLLAPPGAAGSFAGTFSAGAGGTAAAGSSAGGNLAGAGDTGSGGRESAGSGGRHNFPEGGAGGNTPCLNGAMCTGSGGGGCTVSTPFCTPCLTYKDCPSENKCDPQTNRCYRCRRNSECPSGQVCNTLAMVCADQCKQDLDCTFDDSHRVCNTDFGVCVGCMATPQCSQYNNGNNERCYFSACVECFDNSQCMNQMICVAGRCQKPH